jgi:hypothetical protein
MMEYIRWSASPTVRSATSLSEFGTPVELPQCGGRLFERAIPNSDLKDAIGCYPLFCYARRALKQMRVRLVDDPKTCLDEWVRLYQILINRHHLQGIKAFSKTAFTGQFEVPGLVAFQASQNGKTVGMHLWYIQSGVAYSHLGASDQEGYSLGAAYALHWSAITEFKQHCVDYRNHWSGRLLLV